MAMASVKSTSKYTVLINLANASVQICTLKIKTEFDIIFQNVFSVSLQKKDVWKNSPTVK